MAGCRLCCSKSTKLTSSINDLPILDFLKQTKINLSKDFHLPSEVCQLCYGKAKLCSNFISKIIESQKFLSARKIEPSSNSILIDQTEEVVAKIQSRSGVSIKRVGKSSEKDEILIESSSEQDEDEISEGSSSSFSEIFGVEKSDDDEDYKPIPPLKQKKIENHVVNPPLEIPSSFVCANCKGSFTTFDSLCAHMKTRSCFNVPLNCKICEKVFADKKKLQKHAQTHKPKQKLICELCAKEYNNKFDLDIHMESIHRRVFKSNCIFRCTHCLESFHSQMDLLDHVKNHNKEKVEAERLCEICGKNTANRKAYNAHVKKHKEQKKFGCEICNKSFCQKFQLIQHMHVHTKIKSFVCDICQKAYAKRESLRLHRRKEHSDL